MLILRGRGGRDVGMGAGGVRFPCSEVWNALAIDVSQTRPL